MSDGRIQIRQDYDGGNHEVGRPYLLVSDILAVLQPPMPAPPAGGASIDTKRDELEPLTDEDIADLRVEFKTFDYDYPTPITIEQFERLVSDALHGRKAERERDEARAESERLRAFLVEMRDGLSKAPTVLVHAPILAKGFAEAAQTITAFLDATPAPAADGMRMGGLLPGLRHAEQLLRNHNAGAHCTIKAEIERITAAEQRGDST